MSANPTSTVRGRVQAAAVLAGAALWLLALPLILAAPAWLRATHAYGTVVPAAAVLLLVGAGGVKRRFGGSRASPVAGFLALWRRLERVLDPRHDHEAERGLRDLPAAPRIASPVLRFGLALVALAGVQLAGGALAWRSTFWFGWFLAYGGTLGVGIAVLSAGALPRHSGWLLVASSVAVLKPIAVVLGGGTAQADALGPLLPLAVGTTWMVTVAAGVWLLFGIAWWEVGRALWRDGTAPA